MAEPMTTKEDWYTQQYARDLETVRKHKSLLKPGQAVTTIRLRAMAERLRLSQPLSWGMAMYLRIIERGDEDVCYLCERDLNDGNRSVDHVVPKALGGGDAVANLKLCCISCNFRKGDQSLASYLGRRVS